MPIIVDNSFTNDSHGMRAERLNAIQGNLSIIQPELNAPPEITGWASGCYDLFMQKWATAGTESGEKEGATYDVNVKEEKMEEEYQHCRNVGIAAYVDDQMHLKDFHFYETYPRGRNDCVARVKLVLDAHLRHEAEGITHLIPAELIVRLTTAVTELEEALRNQDKERSEAEHAVLELSEAMEYDTKKLNTLKSWWFAIMGKEDPRIGYIGMVNPKGGQGRRLPGIPQNFTYNIGSGVFSWDAVETATSYQLAYRHAGTSENWEQGYQGGDTSSSFFPGAGSWEFKVRARNEHGYGDFSNVITTELEDILLPPAWVYAHYSGAPAVKEPGAPKVVDNNVEVTWAESTRAELYEIWRSIVPINDPPGEFTKIVETSSRRYLDYDVQSLTRHYYYIIATAGELRSAQSVQAMAEILQATPVA